jgi:hypothetical protein
MKFVLKFDTGFLNLLPRKFAKWQSDNRNLTKILKIEIQSTDRSSSRHHEWIMKLKQVPES